MKKLMILMLSAWCGCAVAQTAQELIDNGKNPENVTTFGMGYNLNQYSQLSQINRSNIKRLVPVWSTSLSNDTGELAQPTIYNGVMYVVNGHWTFAIDVATGQQIWRTPVEYERAAARVGQPGVIIRGGATWQNGAYDPEIDLVYWGTGNAEPYNPEYRGGADSLYTASVIAIRPKTGELVWHYQYIPNESYDFDGSAEPVLADLRIDGQVRKVLLNANKNGFMYVIDRTDGKLIAAHPFVKVNWATHIDLKTGRPVLTDIYERAVKGETVEIWPSRGTNASLMAFNPKTGLVYVNSWEISRIMKYSKVNFVLGQGSTGVETSFRTPPSGEPWGYHLAFNPLTGKAEWKVPITDTVLSAGMLATDGGLLFTGRVNGEFIALDQATGQELWKFKTGSGINSPPITYTHNGRQYVTVLSGIGGVLNRVMKVADRVPTGGSVWTFALMPE